ncbi:hypothetical protein NG798_26450 [Ancylothrix sp. C2]|uniref:hypothetical protein n=1 Tax=Ancylothrix sp. D3o TaxID=2953691 RepID=UPI0021BACC1B|nr:hypothetical protein [Ancylothrix sp. D3o]MCT7953344.1 hypothetical protein [Ancylothrix sp. D3o]
MCRWSAFVERSGFGVCAYCVIAPVYLDADGIRYLARVRLWCRWDTLLAAVRLGCR